MSHLSQHEIERACSRDAPAATVTSLYIMLSPRLRTASCATQRRCGLIRSKRPLGRVSSAVTVAEGIGPDPFSFATVPVPEASTWHSSALDQIDLDKARQVIACRAAQSRKLPGWADSGRAYLQQVA